MGKRSAVREWLAVPRFLAGAGLIILAIWLGSLALAGPGHVLLLLALLIFAGLVFACGMRLIAKGGLALFSKGPLPDEGTRLEQQAARQGLPDDPRAYQNGGLVAVATARTEPEAALIARMLNQNDIPAWVDQPHTSVTLWHLQPGLTREGVRVLVPFGRRADAETLLAEFRAGRLADETDAQGTGDAGPLEPAEEEDREARARELQRRARAVALLTFFLFPLGPVFFVCAVVLARRVVRAARQWGPSPALRSALFWCMVAMGLAVCATVALGLIVLSTAF
ncbi:MAG TPA: hypothetical protein VM219_10400 [Phycisphaerae bacterium]|nr:hypothetical protein [Phycisphaerae bacterium]HUS46415.1 hypothetical protein [Phycisphaerae bacterium]